MLKKTISQQLAEKTFKELGIDPKTGKLLTPPSESLNSSPNNPPKPPFRVKALEKTKRQSPRGLAYKHSAVYRNAITLRLLGKKFNSGLHPVKDSRLIEQIDSELRSVVANIREGYKRPTSAEFSTFLGYSQGSLEEFAGDIVDAKDDGLLKSMPGSSLESLNISLKPPPNISSRQHLEDIKRTVREIKSNQLTYEIFLELVNKTDWLLKRAVQGIDKKIVEDEKKNLKDNLRNHWRKQL